MPDTPKLAFYSAFAAMAAGRSGPDLSAFLVESPAPGLAVYRNNVAHGAVEALAQAYPAVQRLVGERFFSAMSAGFRDVCPPRSPVLALYGEGFESFVEQFKPAASLPYLPDIARLDRAWLLAHHAPDRPVLSLGDLAGLSETALADLQLHLHPASRIFAFDTPAYAIWRTNREDQTVERISLADGPETALVWRQNGEVRHRKTGAADHMLLNAITRGASLHAACEAALTLAPDHDPLSAVFSFVRAGIFERTFP